MTQNGLERVHPHVADDQLLRARVIALSVSAAIAAYAANEGHDALLREAVASLERTAAT